MSHDTVVRTRTQALAWGYNNLGGLGTGTTARSPHPTTVIAIPDGTIDLQGGTDFTVALTETGEVWTWGGNARGQLGTGAGATRLVPQRVELPRVESISVGESHVLAVTTHGHLYGWGHNRYAQLGDGTRTDQPHPVEIAAAGRGAHVATGNASSIMIDQHGRVTTWGKFIPGTSALTPAEHNLGLARSLGLPISVSADQVVAGQRHLVVLSTEGTLHAYGLDAIGKPARERVELDDYSWGRVTAISAGDNHTVALTDRGTVLTWGANYHGQLGLLDKKFRRQPVAVRMPRFGGRVLQVVAAGDFTMARTDEHRVYTWGHGAFGQHGSGDTAVLVRPEPATVPDDVEVASVHAGRYHVHALTHATR